MLKYPMSLGRSRLEQEPALRRDLPGLSGMLLACLTVFMAAVTATAQTRGTVLFQSIRTYPVLSPNDEHLIFSTPDERRRLKIFRLTIATGQVEQLTSGEHEDSAATYSADGRQIAFQREWPDGSRDILFMNADGSQPRAVTTTPGINEQHPSFMPDGASILADGNLHADRTRPEAEQNYEIYNIELNGGGVTRLTDKAGWDMYPSASPGGRRFLWQGAAIGSGRSDFDIFISNVEGGERRVMSSSPSYDTHPSWHPSGETIVFASDRESRVDRRTELYVSGLDGGQPRRLTDGGGTDLAYARPRFAPDGNSIVANRNLAGMIDVIRIEYVSR